METCERMMQSSPMRRAGPDRDVGIDDGPRTHRRTGPDRHERADRDIRPERRIRRHRAGPIDARSAAPAPP